MRIYYILVIWDYLHYISTAVVYISMFFYHGKTQYLSSKIGITKVKCSILEILRFTLGPLEILHAHKCGILVIFVYFCIPADEYNIG